MCEIRVTFEPESLCELSQIEICKHLWTNYKIKKSIRAKIEEHSILRNKDEKILNDIFNNINDLSLPVVEKDNLKSVVKHMSFIIWDWLNVMQLRGDRPVDLGCYIDHIKWTKTGDIDSAETIRSMYFSRIFPDCDKTWRTITRYFLEDCILDYYERVESLHTPLGSMSNYSDVVELYWTCRMQNCLQDLVPHLKLLCRDRYVESETLENNLPSILIWYNNCSAMKYFWESLSDDQRIVLTHKYRQLDDVCDVDVAVFFWQQSLTYGVVDVFIMLLGEWRIMRRLIRWPYKKLLMRALEECWSKLPDCQLEAMTGRLYITICDNDSVVDYQVYRQIFWETWERMDTEYKESIDCLYYLEGLINDTELLRMMPAFQLRIQNQLSTLPYKEQTKWSKDGNSWRRVYKVLELTKPWDDKSDFCRISVNVYSESTDNIKSSHSRMNDHYYNNELQMSYLIIRSKISPHAKTIPVY